MFFNGNAKSKLTGPNEVTNKFTRKKSMKKYYILPVSILLVTLKQSADVKRYVGRVFSAYVSFLCSLFVYQFFDGESKQSRVS